ncbi:MAG: arginase family protein [Planctomycetota bacterium]|jgi:arginase
MATLKKIGIVGDPYCVGWACEGITASAAAFRKAGLVEAIGGIVEDVVDFGDVHCDLPPYDDSNPVLLNPEQVKALSRVLADKVEQVTRDGFVPLVFGGEDSVMLGILEGFRRALGAPIGQVFMDAHGDFNTSATSPSGLIGGMENAILAGRGPDELTKLFRDEPQLLEENITLYGTRDLDPKEAAALEQSQVRVWRAERIREVGPAAAMREIVADLRSRVENVYLHIDLDILDESQMSAHVLPVPGGLTREEFVTSAGELIASGLVCGLAVMVFDTRKDPTGSEANKVVEMVSEFIGA